MKVNSLVSPKEEWRTPGPEHGVGIIIQTKQLSGDEVIYCLVEWTHEAEWWNSTQLILAEDPSGVSD